MKHQVCVSLESPQLILVIRPSMLTALPLLLKKTSPS
jgi:hypothetical protein